MSARLAIVIVNFNAREWLQRCLRTVYAQEIIDEMEVVVVDCASTDDSVAFVRREYPTCALIASDENLGFGRGNNVGAKQSSAPILLFLNPDTEVEPGALAELLSFMEEHPEYGAAGGRIYDGDGELERSAGTWPTVFSLVLDRLLARWPILRSGLEHRAHHYWNYGEWREVGWVTGAYLWVRRDAFERLSGFDRDIFMYYEDVDLCYRIREMGLQICFFPGATIMHYRNKAPVEDTRRKHMMYNGLYLFSRKHYSWRRKGLTLLIAYLLHKG